MMTRGSGSGDPGVRTTIKFYDAQIRGCGSGRQNRSYLFMMTRGSGSADPGVTHLLEACTLNFISGSTPDTWIQKHVVVSVKS